MRRIFTVGLKMSLERSGEGWVSYDSLVRSWSNRRVMVSGILHRRENA